MFFKKYGDFVVSIFFLLVGISLIVLAQQLPKSKVMDLGPDFMPTVVGAMVVILAAILLVSTIKDFKVRSAELEKAKLETYDYKRVIISFLLVLVYAFVLKEVGFILCTLVYLPIQMFVLAPDNERGKRNIITYLIVSVIFTFVVFFLFRYGFKIMLSTGPLPF